MLEWASIVVRGIFYALLVAVTAPVAMLFRMEPRPPSVDDGWGYDDNDPGRDIDADPR